MELKTMEYNLSVCKVTDISDINLTSDFYFVEKTIRLSVKMDGEDFVFREYWISR